MAPVGKDKAARLKMLGGLVRLAALRPDGFTAYDLAEHASVKEETARDFLKSKQDGYAEVIPESKASVGPEGGRPANLYRLRPERRTELLNQLVELRHQIDTAMIFSPSEDDLFSPLELLEDTLRELEASSSNPEEWRARLAEAQLELRGTEADLRALQKRKSHHAPVFEQRIIAARRRLNAVKLVDDPLRYVLLKRLSPPKDPIAWLVEKFGTWCGEAPKALGPILVLLDGLQGPDVLGLELGKACRAAEVHVAAFDVAHMANAERFRFYTCLDHLRTATPLAVSDLVLTLDGQSDNAFNLAEEFCELRQQGVWQARAHDSVRTEILGFDLEWLRRFYLAQCTDLLTAPQPPKTAANAAFAMRVTSALSAIVSATVSPAAPGLPFENPKLAGERILNAARGDVFCLDAKRNLRIKNYLTNKHVGYVAEAGHAFSTSGNQAAGTSFYGLVQAGFSEA